MTAVNQIIDIARKQDGQFTRKDLLNAVRSGMKNISEGSLVVLLNRMIAENKINRIYDKQDLKKGGKTSVSITLPIGVGDFHLCLLRKAAVRVARLELLVVFDRLVVEAFAARRLGFGEELVGRPADGFVLDLGQQSATGDEQGEEKRCDNR